MCKNTVIATILLFLVFIINPAVAKKSKIGSLDNAKVAIVMDFDNSIEFVKVGVTIFGNKDYTSDKDIYDFKAFIFEKLNLILSSLTSHEVTLVEALDFSKDESYQKLKKRQKKKFRKQQIDEYYKKIYSQGHTHVLIIKEVDVPINGYQKFDFDEFNVSSFAFYKMPAIGCTHLRFNAQITDLAKRKSMTFPLFYPTSDEDYYCLSGMDFRKHGLKWKSSFDQFTPQELEKLADLIKQLVVPALLHSFEKSGLIADEVTANELLLLSTIDEYLVIEKESENHFIIEGRSYTGQDLKQNLVTMAESGKLTKILIGRETLSKFVFGDISHYFKPAVKDSHISLFRIGHNKAIININ